MVQEESVAERPMLVVRCTLSQLDAVVGALRRGPDEARPDELVVAGSAFVESRAAVEGSIVTTSVTASREDASANDLDGPTSLLRRRHGLTPMQCVVLAMRYRGHGHPVIARALGVGVRAVKKHVNVVLRRVRGDDDPLPGVRLPKLLADTLAELRRGGGVALEPDDAAWLSLLHTTLRRLARHELECSGGIQRSPDGTRSGTDPTGPGTKRSPGRPGRTDPKAASDGSGTAG